MKAGEQSHNVSSSIRQEEGAGQKAKVAERIRGLPGNDRRLVSSLSELYNMKRLLPVSRNY